MQNQNHTNQTHTLTQAKSTDTITTTTKKNSYTHKEDKTNVLQNPFQVPHNPDLH